MSLHCAAIGGFLLSASLLLASSGAVADEASSAAELFRAAQMASKAHHPREAAALYERAHAIEPHSIAKYNEALEWELAREPSRAADAYGLAIQRGELDAQREKDARQSLTRLEARLATVTIAEPRGAKVSVGHLRDAPIPATLHLGPGEHTVSVQGHDCRSTRQFRVRAGATHDLVMSCQAPTAKSVPPPYEEPIEPTPTWKTDVGIVLLAVGAGATLASFPFGAATLDANARWKSSGLTEDDAHDQAIGFRATTNILIGTAVATAGVGLMLIVLD